MKYLHFLSVLFPLILLLAFLVYASLGGGSLKILLGIKPIDSVEINLERHCSKRGSGSELCDVTYEYRGQSYRAGQKINVPINPEFLKNINPFAKSIMDVELCAKSRFPHLESLYYFGSSTSGSILPIKNGRGCLPVMRGGEISSSFDSDKYKTFVPMINKENAAQEEMHRLLQLAIEVETNTGGINSLSEEDNHYWINIYFKIPLYSLFMLYLLALTFIGFALEGISKIGKFLLQSLDS